MNCLVLKYTTTLAVSHLGFGQIFLHLQWLATGGGILDDVLASAVATNVRLCTVVASVHEREYIAHFKQIQA